MFARKALPPHRRVRRLTIQALAQAPPDIDALLARVAERIDVYYKRAQNIMCTEKTIVLPLGHNLAGRRHASHHRSRAARRSRGTLGWQRSARTDVLSPAAQDQRSRAARQGQEGSIGLFRPESADAGTGRVPAAVAPRRLHLHRERVRQGKGRPHAAHRVRAARVEAARARRGSAGPRGLLRAVNAARRSKDGS